METKTAKQYYNGVISKQEIAIAMIKSQLRLRDNYDLRVLATALGQILIERGLAR
jgi:hypothetical protein